MRDRGRECTFLPFTAPPPNTHAHTRLGTQIFAFLVMLPTGPRRCRVDVHQPGAATFFPAAAAAVGRAVHGARHLMLPLFWVRDARGGGSAAVKLCVGGCVPR